MYAKSPKILVALSLAAGLSVGMPLTGGCQNKDQPKDSTRHSDGTPHKPGDMHPDHGRQPGAATEPATP
jgi:hypothetical protein